MNLANSWELTCKSEFEISLSPYYSRGCFGNTTSGSCIAVKGCMPCLIAESTMVLRIENLKAPLVDRKVPDIFNFTFIIRSALSAQLLSGGTFLL